MDKHKTDTGKQLKRVLRRSWSKHAHKWWKRWFDDKHPKYKKGYSEELTVKTPHPKIG